VGYGHQFDRVRVRVTPVHQASERITERLMRMAADREEDELPVGVGGPTTDDGPAVPF
jgi:hypothetical protein